MVFEDQRVMDKKILLIELAGIGDTVLSSPAIRNLRRSYPDSFIYLLTFAGPAELIQKSPYLDRIFVFHKGLKGFFNNILVLNELRGLHIDVAINLYQHYTFRGIINMVLLLKFIRPKKSLGRNTDGKGFFYDIKIEDKIDTERHDVEYKLDLIQALGCDIKERELEVWFDDSDTKKVKEFFEENSILNSDFLIGINPGGHRPAHRWNWENFAKVAEVLAKRYRAKIVITGAKDENWLAKRISQVSTQLIDASDRLSLTQLIALIRRCNLYISNDTAPMHIANALKTPLVAIMGPGVMKTSPYQKNNCIILRKDVECSPCYKFRCDDMKCLKTITTGEVIQASESLLKDYVK